jgi:hypothetical protein
MIGREGLFAWAVRSYFQQRHEVPAAVAGQPHLQFVRLSSAREVDDFLTRHSP